MKRAKNDRAGFSLVEAMVGMAVVGILFIALYAMQVSIVGKVQFAREDLRATEILVKKVEQIRLYSWTQMASSTAIPPTFTASFDPEEDKIAITKKTQPKKTISYQGQITINNGPTECTYGDDMKQVTVNLQWISANGLPRQRSVMTYVAKYGMQNYLL